MPMFNDVITESELKRGMRPDAHRYLRPDWRRLRAGLENDPLYRLYENICAIVIAWWVGQTYSAAQFFEVAMIIAGRTLTLRNGDRNIEIAISIFAPECQKPGAWHCRYDIGWPEGTRSFEGWGVDAVQALAITLGMIGAEIYSSNYHKSGDLFWIEPGNGYGFPVPPTYRDLLRGDDAKYF